LLEDLRPLRWQVTVDLHRGWSALIGVDQH